MKALKTPQTQNVAFLKRFAVLLLTALGLAVSFTASAFGQGFAGRDGSVPVPMDWSSEHVLFTGGFTPEQAATTWNEPRAYVEWLLHGNAPAGSGLVRKQPRRHSRGKMRRDWAISLGAGGVAQGMSPAKYSFDANAAPSCTSDFVVFPINASTGNTRTNVVGTFTGEAQNGATTSITITPAGAMAVTLILTSSSTSNAG